jgi:hypothetical protein
MSALDDFETALNAFSAATLAAVTRKGTEGVPNGVIPVSRFCQLGATGVAYTTSTSAKTITFTAGNPLLMAGQSFTLGAQTVSYAAGTTTLFYVQLQNGVPTYVASQAEIPESNTNMYFGQLTSDATGNITSITLLPVSRLDTFRPSTTAKGSSIPVSGGTPDAASGLLWT